MHSIFQICFWRFGLSAAWALLAIYSIFQICFWRFGQVLHGIHLQFIHVSKSVLCALAKCCIGIYLQCIQFSKSVFGALAKWCMEFTCNLQYSIFQICFWRFGQVLHGLYLQFIQFPNLFRALWPSAAWDLLAIYSIFQICFRRFGQVLHGIYLQFIQFSKSVFGALAKCCIGIWFTCNVFNFPNLFLALWPSAAWDFTCNLQYSIFQICFWRFGQVLQFPNLFRALWPSAAWDLLAMYSIFQICFWCFGQVLHGIYF